MRVNTLAIALLAAATANASVINVSVAELGKEPLPTTTNTGPYKPPAAEHTSKVHDLPKGTEYPKGHHQAMPSASTHHQPSSSASTHRQPLPSVGTHHPAVHAPVYTTTTPTPTPTSTPCTSTTLKKHTSTPCETHTKAKPTCSGHCLPHGGHNATATKPISVPTVFPPTGAAAEVAAPLGAALGVVAIGFLFL